MTTFPERGAEDWRRAAAKLLGGDEELAKLDVAIAPGVHARPLYTLDDACAPGLRPPRCGKWVMCWCM